MDALGRASPRTLAAAAFAAAAILWLAGSAGLDAWHQRAEGRHVRQLSATETAVLELSRRVLRERDLMLEAAAMTLDGDRAGTDGIAAALPDGRRHVGSDLAALAPAVRGHLAVPSIVRRLRDRPDAIEALLADLSTDLADLDRARATLVARLAHGVSTPVRTRIRTASRAPVRPRARTAIRTVVRTGAPAARLPARTTALAAAALEASAASERLVGTLHALQRGLCFEPGRAAHRIDGLRRAIAALRDADIALAERTALRRLAASLDIGDDRGAGMAMTAATARAASRVRRARSRLDGLSRERILPPRVSDELRVLATALGGGQAVSDPADLRALRRHLARLDELARSRIGTLADDIAARGSRRLAADATLALLGLWIVVGVTGGARLSRRDRACARSPRRPCRRRRSRRTPCR